MQSPSLPGGQRLGKAGGSRILLRQQRCVAAQAIASWGSLQRRERSQPLLQKPLAL